MRLKPYTTYAKSLEIKSANFGRNCKNIPPISAPEMEFTPPITAPIRKRKESQKVKLSGAMKSNRSVPSPPAIPAYKALMPNTPDL